MFEPRPLADAVAKQVGGGTPSRQVAAYWNGSIPWASVKDFADGGDAILSTQESITAAGLRASASNLIPAGTPLVCTRMAVGRSAVAVMSVAINQDVKALSPANGTTPAYLLRLLQFVQPRAEAAAVGSTVKGIRIQDYLSITAPMAPRDEQARIAEILDTLDTTIRQTEAIVEKLKQVKQGLLHDLLTRGIDANGELRPLQSQAPHLYTESPLGWIPREWASSTVGVEFEIQLGKMLDAEKNSGVVKPYLGNRAVQWDRIDVDDLQLMAMSHSDLARFRLRVGDLLVCEGGEVGRAAIWQGEIDECYYQKALHRLRPRRDFEPRLLLLMLRHWVDGGRLVNYVSQTSIAHLTQEKLASVPISVPAATEQRAIAEAVAGHDARVQAEAGQLSKLQMLKSGLMDDLLAGRVRVTGLLA